MFSFFSRNYIFFRSKSQNILKVFLETTLVHVSCYPDHYEPKIFFSIFEVRNYPSIYDFGLEVSPENAISEGRPTLCNCSQKAGALPSEVRIENDMDRKFSKSKFFKVFLKTTFLHDSCYPVQYYISRNFFFKIGKNENFDYKINTNCLIGIKKLVKMKTLITQSTAKPPT